MDTDSSYEPKRKTKSGPYTPTLIIHGGAGNITRSKLPPELYAQYQASLTKYLKSTHSLLVNREFDAVTAACHAVSLMEDDPLFNCGRGSVFTVEGGIEMEASLMVSSVSGFESAMGDVSDAEHDWCLENTPGTCCSIPEMKKERTSSTSTVRTIKRKRGLPGRTKKSAAVSMITRTRHPILLAKEVLEMADLDDEEQGNQEGALGTSSAGDNERIEKSQLQENHLSTYNKLPPKGEMHAHLSGQWVEEWGFRIRGLERKSRKWFWTRKRWDEHRRGLELDTSDEAWRQKLGQQSDSAISSFGEETDISDTHCSATIGNSIPSPTIEYNLENKTLKEVLEVPSQGTVGAVCMDSWGNLCVATSTGGFMNKRSGRIGDTPTVGAGFWAENWEESVAAPLPGDSVTTSAKSAPKIFVFDALLKAATQSAQFWIGDCIPTPQQALPSSNTAQGQAMSTSSSTANRTLAHGLSIQKQPDISTPVMAYLPAQPAGPGVTTSTTFSKGDRNEKYSDLGGTTTLRRAVAVSGTGNGDSFLRTNAARTAAAIPKFALRSPSEMPISLQEGVTAIAGPGGELQRSAEGRWGKGTGEGEGGMIGIEIVISNPSESDLVGKTEENKRMHHNDKDIRVRTNLVSDFNCGGMWRAYFEKKDNGKIEPQVMVFKEEYRL